MRASWGRSNLRFWRILVTLTRSVSYSFVSLTLALFAGQASALQADYVDIDPVFVMLSDGGSVSGNFNITLSNSGRNAWRTISSSSSSR